MAINEESADKETVSTYLLRTLVSAGKTLQDEQEALWDASTERKKFVKYAKTIGITGGIFYLFSIAIFTISSVLVSRINGNPDLYAKYGDISQPSTFEYVTGIIGASVISMVLIFWIVAIHTKYRNIFNRNYRLGLVQKLNASDGKLAAEAIDGKLDLASLWARTQERISTYHSIATDQAEASFRTGKRFAIGGFFVIVLAGLGAIFAPTTAATIAAGGVAAVAAAMTSYIGATFMKAQSEASAQLREFFNQPVEFSRVLSIERLIQTLEEKDRPAAVQDVIRSMMPSGSSLSKSDGE